MAVRYLFMRGLLRASVTLVHYSVFTPIYTARLKWMKWA